MDKDQELATEEPEDDVEDDDDNEEDDEDSDSDGDDSYSDLASSHDEEDEASGRVETKPVKAKGEGLNKGKKSGEIPFVFKGNFKIFSSLFSIYKMCFSFSSRRV